MSDQPRRKSIFGRLWWLVDASRRTLMNLLFLALLAGLLWLAFKPGTPPLEAKTALLLDLEGPITEQKSGNARDSALKQLQGEDMAQTRLRDVLAVLDAAAKDSNVPHAVLLLDDLGGVGLPILREVAAAMERFKAVGKPIYAWGSGYSQGSYFLAAHATEIWLHPMGSMVIQGFGRPRNYYKDAFDKVGVQATVLRVGKFKSFGEIYSASGPSAETTEAERFLYDALWASWLGSVEGARKLPAGSVMALIDDLPARLEAQGGDMAKLALTEKLVDQLKTRDQMRDFLIEKGAKAEQNVKAKHEVTFKQVTFNGYLSRLKPTLTGDAVGVIVAEGGISDGQAPPGSIGGESTAALIRKARADDSIKAIVLRVNSPGGSAFGSELIRRELEITREAGKPVVVSMGNLAASGGYWISTAADEIIADENTITGSIGVIAVLPNVKGAMDKIGVNAAGYGTTWLANAFDPRQAFDPRVASLIQSSINHVYTDFIARAAQARNTTPEAINEVAQGRVWTGKQAVERGLVDRTGSLGDAIAAAASRGKLAADARVAYIEREPGRLQQALEAFGVSTDSVITRVLAELAPSLMLADPVQAMLPGAPQSVVNGVRQDLGWLADVTNQRKPFDAVTHCLCSAP